MGYNGCEFAFYVFIIKKVHFPLNDKVAIIQNGKVESFFMIINYVKLIFLVYYRVFIIPQKLQIHR